MFGYTVLGSGSREVTSPCGTPSFSCESGPSWYGPGTVWNSRHWASVGSASSASQSPNTYGVLPPPSV